MREKCDNCGKLDNIRYEFRFEDVVFSYRLKFCSECGEKIKKILDDGVN